MGVLFVGFSWIVYKKGNYLHRWKRWAASKKSQGKSAWKAQLCVFLIFLLLFQDNLKCKARCYIFLVFVKYFQLLPSWNAMQSMGQSKVSAVPVTFNVTVLLRLFSPLWSPRVHLYVPLFRLVAFLILSEKAVSLESPRDPPSSFGYWDSTSRNFHAAPSPSPAIWKTQIYFSSRATVSSWVLGEREF